ncbi:MAG: hypothetical protein QGH39_12290 [Candidatus Thermoplasmatota archaeon]|nr:hypothetical protein [Candidatus Thermoplasmatota archaeon]MDP7266325.1 hypothetical protein [Candidatus Thermoplasmatota archaeon]
MCNNKLASVYLIPPPPMPPLSVGSLLPRMQMHLDESVGIPAEDAATPKVLRNAVSIGVKRASMRSNI